MRTIIIILLSIMSSTLVAADKFRPTVRVVTGGYEAMNALNGGTLHGSATDAVIAFMNSHDVDYTITPMPWSRAYNLLLTKDDVIIYPLTRSVDRESKFTWLTKVKQQSYVLLGHIDVNPSQLTKAQIISGKYFTLCEGKSFNCSSLANYGFPNGNILRIHGIELDKILNLVNRGRASFIWEGLEAVKKITDNDITLQDKFIPIAGSHSTVADYLAAYNLKPEILKLFKK